MRLNTFTNALSNFFHRKNNIIIIMNDFSTIHSIHSSPDLNYEYDDDDDYNNNNYLEVNNNNNNNNNNSSSSLEKKISIGGILENDNYDKNTLEDIQIIENNNNNNNNNNKWNILQKKTIENIHEILNCEFLLERDLSEQRNLVVLMKEKINNCLDSWIEENDNRLGNFKIMSYFVNPHEGKLGSDLYLRNNKRGGVKNILNFPSDSTLQNPLRVSVRANGIKKEDVVVVGTFECLDEVEAEEITTNFVKFEKGQLIRKDMLSFNNFKNHKGDYFMATLVESPCVEDLHFEFQIKTWHYCWKGGRHKTKYRHRFTCFVLKIQQEQFKVLDIVYTSDFKIASARRAAGPNEKGNEGARKKKKAKIEFPIREQDFNILTRGLSGDIFEGLDVVEDMSVEKFEFVPVFTSEKEKKEEATNNNDEKIEEVTEILSKTHIKEVPVVAYKVKDEDELEKKHLIQKKETKNEVSVVDYRVKGEDELEKISKDSLANEHRRENKDERLKDAIESGSLELVRKLYLNGANIVRALHKASYHGKIDICRFLILEAKVDVDEKDEVGFTALHCAAHNGKINICNFLIFEANADVFALDIDGNSPFQIATKFGQTVLAKWFRGKFIKGEMPLKLESCREFPINTNKKSEGLWSMVGQRVAVQKIVKSGFLKRKKKLKGTCTKFNEIKVKYEICFDEGSVAFVKAKEIELLQRISTTPMAKVVPSAPMREVEPSAPPL